MLHGTQGEKTLSEENQDELNNLTKKHKAENADMVENILDNEDDEAKEDEGEDASQAAPQAPAAPDCPICYELMTPPTRIFQCGAGHLVCGTCRPRLQVFAPQHRWQQFDSVNFLNQR